jgi:ubiquinone/menaquinone biosynthesis C-methylase UbiE
MIMQTTTPFDVLAETYDADFTRSVIGRLQRNRVWSFLSPLLLDPKKKLKILEINCGTGEDALQVAGMGHEVIATDASAVMIQKAMEKMNGTLYPAAVQFFVCSFERLASQFKNEQFDMVISNFAGLNCIPEAELTRLSRVLSTLLKEEGVLFAVLLSRYCMREIIHYGLRVNFTKAFQRFRGSASLAVNGTSMPVYYHSPGILAKLLFPHFSLKRKHPVGLFIPPSYFEAHYSGKMKRLKRLYNLEIRFGHSFLSSFGDHYCAIFKNRGAKT